MKNILKAEFRRNFLDKKFFVLFLTTLIMSFLLGLYMLNSFIYIKLEPTEEIERYHGKEAIKKFKENGKHNEEYLTTEGLLKDLEIYKELYSKYEDVKTKEFEIELSKMKYFLVLPYAFEPKNGSPKYRIDYENLTQEEVNHFYENREKHEVNTFKEKTNNPLVMDKLLGMESKVEKPFKVNNEKVILFDDVLNGIFLIYIYVSVICIFFIAPIFSEPYQVGEDELFRTAKYGKKYLGKIKILVGMLKGILLFITNIFIYLVIILNGYGISILNIPVQIALSPILPYPLNLGDIIMIILLSGICNLFYLMAFVFFVSSNTKSVLVSLTVPVFCLMLNFSISNWLKVKSNLLDMILKFIPNTGNALYKDIFVDYKFFTIAKEAIWSPYFVIASSIILGIFFIYLSNKSYKKHQ